MPIFTVEGWHSDPRTVLNDVEWNVTIREMEKYVKVWGALMDRHAAAAVMLHAICFMAGFEVTVKRETGGDVFTRRNYLPLRFSPHSFFPCFSLNFPFWCREF